MNILKLIGRDDELFTRDIANHEKELREIVSSSRYLVIGGAGSIGQAVTKEIFKRNPRKLHVIDISENNIVELVRDIRSSFGYTNGDFQTFAMDVGSLEYDAFIKTDGEYDYVLNLAALKHVRSEKDPFTLMRMIEVNIFNTLKTIEHSIEKGVTKYFCVSSDKAANPANMMGATKRIMELYLMQKSEQINISTARFANVAFSDGSLLHGFTQRISKRQPIVAPDDIKRYFIIPKESGELCLMSCIFGSNRDIFFPKPGNSLHLIKFSDLAIRYLKGIGYEPYLCKTEDEARELSHSLPQRGQWPCLFTKSETTGEKHFEEFFTENEVRNMGRFENIGIIKNEAVYERDKIDHFEKTIRALRKSGKWTKAELVDSFFEVIPDFEYIDKGKYLDAKM
jgi:FlaA1/EpsC-like NDP-sugar epimerase